MIQKFHYGTVSEAVEKFRKQGYLIDFNLTENCFTCANNNLYNFEDFEIVDLYHYEGESDPGDGAMVYALESKSGLKGILVTGYGIYVDPYETMMIGKLHYRNPVH